MGISTRENRWDVVISPWYKQSFEAVMKGNAVDAIYVIGQMGLDNPHDCDCDCTQGVHFRKSWEDRAEDDWQKWLHRNHELHNATVWRICNAVRPGFIEELAEALREDMAKRQPFFTPSFSKSMLEGFFNEDPAWLGKFRPSAKAA